MSASSEKPQDNNCQRERVQYGLLQLTACAHQANRAQLQKLPLASKVLIQSDRNSLQSNNARPAINIDKMRMMRESAQRLLMAALLLVCIGAREAAAAAASLTNPTSDGSGFVLITPKTVYKYNLEEKNTDFWLSKGRNSIGAALKYEPIRRQAKNAILFIGDGMSLSTITSARIFQGQISDRSGEESSLSFEAFPNVGLVKTYNVDQQVPDSAATATAILCGVKTNFYMLGVNANVQLDDSNCQNIQQNKVSSIIQQAQEAGKSTGIVTNTRITHATPAAAYAHVSQRRWESDANVPRKLAAPCKDIARQLIEDEPGNKLNVIMGGGRRAFFGNNFQDPGPAGHAGTRLDGRNLIESWIEQRRAVNPGNFAFVNSTRDLHTVDADTTDYLLGLFSFSHMAYEELRDSGPNGEPSLSEMVEKAIKILSKNPNGYVLLVEGGRIDHAHHENVAGVALRETIALSWAVERARMMVNVSDTLIAVTSDHAHALTINGIAQRGNPILGVTKFKENSTQVPYTTLLYGTGPGNHVPRPDPTSGPNSTEVPYYVHHAAIHQQEAFHDGTDVAVFAVGPYAHLFQGVQEQSYIAHVFGYALCIGQYAGIGDCAHTRDSQNEVGQNDHHLKASVSIWNRLISSAATTSRAQSGAGAAALIAVASLCALALVAGDQRHVNYRGLRRNP